MENKEVIQRLREELEKNHAFNAVMHMLALRNRARGVMTVHSLVLKMSAEGFKYGAQEYRNIIQILAELGIGEVAYDRKKRAKALVNIKYTLQSVGAAACGQDVDLTPYHQRDLKKHTRKHFVEVAHTTTTPSKKKSEILSNMTFSLTYKGKPVKVEISKGISSEELVGLINTFQQAS